MMPPAVVVAGIGAAGALGAGALGARAANKASKYQYDAQMQALKYQQDQSRAREESYNRAYADYQRRYDQWLERNYGVKANSGTGAGGFLPTGTKWDPTTGAVNGQAGGKQGAAGPTLAEIAAAPTERPVEAGTPQPTKAGPMSGDFWGWHNRPWMGNAQ